LPPTPDAGVPVRDAATVILVRRPVDGGPQVLMGQRGAAAVFMASKFVFPGGAVDPDDLALAAEGLPEPVTARRLAVETVPEVARALPLAAVRELWEETGLMLGRPDPAAAARVVPPSWRGFHAAGLVPNVAALRLVFRAVTPPGRPRRFDARFFLAEARDLAAEDLVPSGEELGHLAWLDLAAARDLELPFVTEVVLGELEELLAGPELDARRPVPYFWQGADGPRVRLL
jgi:8-oxo-dGTP pyrophosphatase MutT (NUDIX family)